MNVINPKKEELLPLPSKDLPIPEKELPAHAESRNFLRSKWLKIGIIATVIALAVSGAYFLGKNTSNQQIACTQEAKLCSDGSSVGRTGPKCEFTACPEITPLSDPTANLKTFNSVQGYSFNYPEEMKEFSPHPKTGLKRLDGVFVGYQDTDQTVSFESYPNPDSLSEIEWWNENSSTLIASQDSYFPDTPNIASEFKLSQKKIGNNTYLFAVPEGLGSQYFITNGSVMINIIPGFMRATQLESILSTFKFINQTSTTPTCTPRPACLDATPRCLIPETPDMCPSIVVPSQ